MTTSTKKTTARRAAPKSTAAKTPTKRTAARKTVAKKTAAAKPAPKVVSIVEPVVNAPDLRKRELVDMVVERSGVKKRDAKPAVEAALAVLGECIASGRELNLPPLGKLRINRSTEHHNGRVTVCKIRQPNETPANDDEGPLSEE